MQENSNLISQQNEINAIPRGQLLWMLLGWAISWEYSWLISLEIGEAIKRSYGISLNDLPSDVLRSAMFIGFFIGGLIGGAGAGTSIGWVLRKENVIRRKISYLSLVIGWSIAGGIGLLFYRLIDITIGGSLCGLIGGATMIFVLWKENILRDKPTIIFISLGWVLGLTIGWGISSTEDIVQFILPWLIAGTMLGWILLSHVKVDNQIRVFIWIIFGWLIGGAVFYIATRLALNYSNSLEYPVDYISRGIRELFFILISWIIGIIVSISITTWVLLRERKLDYAQSFGLILLGLVSIGIIFGISLWVLSALRIDIDDLAYFAIHNVIGGVISWGIMIWVLRKNAIQK